MQDFNTACAARKCTECCGIISFPAELVTRYRDRFQQQPVKEIWKDGFAALITGDRRCVFLSAAGRCAIYEARPGVCIMYGISRHQPCPYLTHEGKRRTREDTRRVRNLIRDAVREEFGSRPNLS
jgi:Fe-S-cluster containining protein